jgi:hypothetical protein
MSKKIIISIVAILMPLLASAYDAKINGFYFNLNQSEMTAEVTMPENQSEYSGGMSIPAEVIYNGNTYSVTSIGDCAFSGCTALTSISIPNSVTSIGEYAFENCAALTSISIPNSVTYIGKQALNSTGYYESQPNGVVYIDNCAIGVKGSISDLTFKAGTRLIASEAFYNNEDLISVIIPGSVVSIGDQAFADNYNNLTSVTINEGVQIIGKGAFSNCWALTTISIGYGVTSIGRNAFYQCEKLTSISIPNSVTSIGEYAFYYCNNLVSITLPSSVSVGEKAFEETKWFNNQPDGLMYFGDVAYKYKGKMPENTSIEIKEGTTALLSGVFSGCSGLTSISIPNSVKIIGESAFSKCSGLTSVHITDLSSWCKIDFYGNGSNPLEYAHHIFLNGTEIKDLIFPDDVTSIGARLFSGCSGLTSISIPNSVKSIGESAFSDCNNLTSITIPNDVTRIEGNTFKGCSSLTSINIPSGVTSIGYNAFSNCSGLTSVTIPNNMTSISQNAFSGCSGLASVTFHCQQIGSWFSGLTGVNTVTIGDEVTSISDNAFKNCSGLTSITIPEGVTSIGNNVFSGCSSLASVTLHCQQIGSWFSGLSSISDLTIGDNVTSIGESAFNNCSGLTSITIGSKVGNIGSAAFGGCNNLGSVTVLAETPPVAQQNTFPKYTIELKVPESAAQSYLETDPWSNFTTIKTLAGTEVKKKKCAMPVITISNDRLHYVSETEGVDYHVVITAPQSMKYSTSGNFFPFTKKITISVYASKKGWEDSDTATLELDDLKVIGDANMDGKVDAADLVTTANIIMGK